MPTTRPFSLSDRFDPVRLMGEAVPGLAASLDDIVVGFEDEVRQPVVAEILPDVFHRIQFRRSGRQGKKRDIVRYAQLASGVPARPIEKENGVSAFGDDLADFDQMQLHGFGIGAGHHKSGGFGLLGTDGTEDIGPVRPLILRRRWAGSPFGPSSGALVFLPDPCLVLPPDLNLDVLPELCTKVGHLIPKCLLEAGDRLLVLSVVTGTRGKLGIAHLA